MQKVATIDQKLSFVTEKKKKKQEYLWTIDALFARRVVLTKTTDKAETHIYTHIGQLVTKRR